VKKEFEAQGLAGGFDPKKFDAYVAVLVTASTRDKAQELLRTKMAKIESANALPPCPMCGSPVVRAPKWDRFFKRTDNRGWSCTAGGVQHFLLHNMKPAMEKFAAKWEFLDSLYEELRSGKITINEYEERINQRWNQGMQGPLTATETTRS
jgi:hypothetical protein